MRLTERTREEETSDLNDTGELTSEENMMTKANWYSFCVRKL